MRHSAATVAAGNLNVRLTPRDRERLAKLQRRLDAGQAQVVREGLVHLLATIERGEPIHRYVPSEQREES